VNKIFIFFQYIRTEQERDAREYKRFAGESGIQTGIARTA
jgi:hypothetical protein